MYCLFTYLLSVSTHMYTHAYTHTRTQARTHACMHAHPHAECIKETRIWCQDVWLYINICASAWRPEISIGFDHSPSSSFETRSHWAWSSPTGYSGENQAPWIDVLHLLPVLRLQTVHWDFRVLGHCSKTLLFQYQGFQPQSPFGSTLQKKIHIFF